MSNFRKRAGFLAYYGTVICRHWVVFLPILAIVPMAVAGLLGRGLGIQYLFRDQKTPFDASFSGDSAWLIPLRMFGSAYFETQVYATALLGLLWTTALLLEDKFARLNRTYLPNESRVFHYLPGVALLGLVPLLAAFTQLSRQIFYDTSTSIFMLLLPLVGYLLGLCVFYVTSKAAFWLGDRSKIGKISATLSISCFVIAIAAHIPVVLPAKLLFIILACFIVVYTAMQLVGPTARVVILGGALLYAGGVNSFRSEKYGFPEMDAHYSKKLHQRPSLRSYWNDNHRVTNALDLDRRQALGCRPTDNALGHGLIDPIANLQRWYQNVVPPSADRGGAAVRQPKMVLMATSGGAYRATYWTARTIEMLLADDRPGGPLSGFRSNIRLLTGASGGMVASAYFAVEDPADEARTALDLKIRDDIKSALDNRADWRRPFSSIIRNPLASDWDSLSAIARQMVLVDMPGFLLPFGREDDRGRELERHWKALDKSFGSLRDSEARGIRPSMVVSPTLADTGLPLLISNLDLDTIYRDKKEAIELFKLLPGTQATVKVQTAVRMSATFPFISPGVRLPTSPPYRVIDAGYYDNFGIGVAVAYLSEPAIKSWLQRCTSGVMVVQIRAWPQDAGDSAPLAPVKPGLVAKWTNAFAWLTTPIEGVANARSTTNFFRNRRELCALQDLYRNYRVAGPRKAVGSECQDDKDFLQTVEFEPLKLDDGATFTWDLHPSEQAEMTALLKAPNIVNARAALAKFWREDLQ